MLHLNNWSFKELATAIATTPQEINKVWPAIEKAYLWARGFITEANLNQVNAYLTPSIQVAFIASKEMALGLSSALAAILAPLFLQGYLSKENIEDFFGSKMASVLVELNNLKHFKLEPSLLSASLNNPDVAAPRVLAMLLQISDIIRVSSSACTLSDLNSELIYCSHNRLLLNLKFFYIPLAHRLRLYTIQAKLADFWLKHTDASTYYSITSKLGMSKLQRQQKLNLIAEEVHSAIQTHGINFILKKRIKCIYSIWHKIQRLKVDFNEIQDLAAVRIILQGMHGKSLQEEKIVCWKVLTILSDLYNPVCNLMRDWISIPRDTSYESLHLTFETYKCGRLEVQVRTERMDYIAEHGAAAHWKYKDFD